MNTRRLIAPAAAHLRLAAWLILIGTLFVSAPAFAGVPDPRYSDADTCLVMSPAGAFTYVVRLRDDSLAPVPNVDVVLDFNAASGVVLCTSADPDNDRRVVARSDQLGVVTFRVRGGGVSNGPVQVEALASLVRIVYARSTDLDADLVVDAEDVTAHDALAPNARAGDYDCDGDRDVDDRLLVVAQGGHNCLTVPALAVTWARVKSLYR